MTTLSQRYGPAPPPPSSMVGVEGWLRANLFSSWGSSVTTVALLAVIVWGVVRAAQWLLFSSEWDVITQRAPLYVVGTYPRELYWRPEVALLLVSGVMGMAWRTWGGVSKPLVGGFGAIIFIVALLPYSMDFLYRALLLAVPFAIGAGYGLAHVLRPASRPKRTAIAGAVVLVLAPLLIVGFNFIFALLLAVLVAIAAGYGLAYTLRFASRWESRWKRVAVVGAATLVMALLVIIGADFVRGLEPVREAEVGGLMLNLLLATYGIVLSMPLGILLALGRRSRLPVVKVFCVGFIEIIRGVPLITLLFMSRHILPLTFPESIDVNLLYLSGITITLFSSAYMAENVRGGMAAVSPQQSQAAEALGLKQWQTTLFITLPQGLRNIIPAIVGQFISLFKDTSLVFIIGMLDLVEIGRAGLSGNIEFQDNGMEVYIFLALVFWVFTFSMAFISRRIERTLGVGRR